MPLWVTIPFLSVGTVLIYWLPAALLWPRFGIVGRLLGGLLALRGSGASLWS